VALTVRVAAERVAHRRVPKCAAPGTPAEPFAVIGTPAFFAKHDRPGRPQDLPDFRCILLRQSAGLLDRWQFTVGGQDITVGVAGPLIVGRTR
jgi:hypothetical protein